jgi:hypothetical protein
MIVRGRCQKREETACMFELLLTSAFSFSLSSFAFFLCQRTSMSSPSSTGKPTRRLSSTPRYALSSCLSPPPPSLFFFPFRSTPIYLYSFLPPPRRRDANLSALRLSYSSSSLFTLHRRNGILSCTREGRRGRTEEALLERGGYCPTSAFEMAGLKAFHSR